MELKRRTQAERTAATRGALTAAARRLWAERGYAAVGTPEIASEAGVTRGAMYHQFADKAALFRHVVETVEADVTQRIATTVAGSGATDPATALHAAVDAWLDACEDPEVRRLLLLDGPVVLGWEGFRDVMLTHVLIGALDEAAMVVATSEDRARTRAEASQVLHTLLDGLVRRV